MACWDNWFARDGDTWHVFYLQAPLCVERSEWVGYSNVGHATSKDLVHWTNHGPVLAPIAGSWNDIGIATGSVVKHDGKWWMVFTGRGSRIGGVGLAVSDDLMTWTKVGDGPVVPFDRQFDGTWKGEPVKWHAIADPYLYESPVDGWYYMILNSGIVGADIRVRGCLTSMRSRDLKTWEPHAVLSWPQWWERMETPQLWQREGRWYLYFGGAHDHGLPEKFLTETPAIAREHETRGNFVFTAGDMDGPFEPAGDWCLRVPGDRFGYIAKVIPGFDGGDVLFLSIGKKLSRPYPLSYAADGSLRVGEAR